MKNMKITSWIMYMRTDDIDLRNYGKKKINETFSADTVNVIQQNLQYNIPNFVSTDINTSIKALTDMTTDLLQIKCLDTPNIPIIVEGFTDAVLRDVAPFPMDIVMSMYNSKDDFLVKKSKELVIKNYEMYVYDIIHTCYSSYVPKYTEELFQCGCIGLLKAMENYDCNYKFNTYCTNFVKHEISAQINFHNNNSTVHFNNIQKKINNAITEIKNEGFEPSVEKIAIVSELKPEVISREMDYIERTKFKYLDAGEGSEYTCKYETTPEAMFAQKEREDSLYKAIMDLPEDYRKIVAMKCDDCTNEKIARIMKISIGKVKTKYQRALQLMKRNPKLYETFSDYYSEATVYMARYSVDAIMPHKALEAQMDDIMKCVGALNKNDGSIFYVDASDPMGQMTFAL